MTEKYIPRCRIFLLDAEKFRTNLLVLFFDLPLQRETATRTALLAEVLKKADWQRTAKEAETLYGALWDISVVKKGDRQLLLFSLEFLKNVEAEKAIAFFRRLIWKREFDETLVERQKEILRKRLKSQRDQKKAYVRKRILEETAEGTAMAVSADGYEEELDEISVRTLMAWYRKILEQEEVKVFFCGDMAEKNKIIALRKDFSGKVSCRKEVERGCPKNGPRFLQETARMEQARLAMGFWADTETGARRAALLLLNHLLGGSPDSSLFRKIREEAGLCYDVKSELEPMSPYLFVQAGITEKDAKKAGKMVLQCICQMKEDGVSKEKLEQAKAYLLRSYEGMVDNPWAMVDFMAEQALQSRELSTEKFLKQIERTEKEDIEQALKHLELQVVYLLSGKEEFCGE